MTSHQPVNPVSLCPYRGGGGMLFVSGESEEQLLFTLVFWLQAGCCILTQLALVGSGPLIQKGEGIPGHLQTPSNRVLPLNIPLTSQMLSVYYLRSILLQRGFVVAEPTKKSFPSGPFFFFQKASNVLNQNKMNAPNSVFFILGKG